MMTEEKYKEILISSAAKISALEFTVMHLIDLIGDHATRDELIARLQESQKTVSAPTGKELDNICGILFKQNQP